MSYCYLLVRTMNKTVEILGEEWIYRGRKVRLKKLFLRIRGSETFHEIIDFGESVAILPFKDDNTVLLERQFRGAIGGWILEIPAGRIEGGEKAEDAAKRELREEIGYVPGDLIFLGTYILTPGYSNERIHIFVARELRFVGQSLEEHEAIRTVELQYDSLLDMVLKGEIKDAKTVLAVLMYEARMGRARKCLER